MDSFLKSQKHTIITRVNQQADLVPTNTDFRHRGYRKEYFVDSRFQNDEILIPPLNTDIRFSKVLPQHSAWMEANAEFIAEHPHRPHVHEQNAKNFSWHIITSDDDADVVAKKRQMYAIQNQHLCGSCWAMAIAACISDCFVVGGTVTWKPNIAPTYLMMIIPSRDGNGQCEGGNPAVAAVALESIPVCDTSCIDYSWCSNDTELCTSAAAANHFKSGLGEKLNNNIPKITKDGNGTCYFSGEKYVYEIDKGSDVLYINTDAPTDSFRSMIKAHIVDFGPPLAGYAVLKNFVTGNFTDPDVNQGVYFDRADYSSKIRPGQELQFSDTGESDIKGLHAVRIVGWGVAENVQYDTDKYGTVPFWWAANSWGSGWGNMQGYFKMAMYPYNKMAQFDKQITVRGYPVGGMILLRCTRPPRVEQKHQIEKRYLDAIRRSKPDAYYQMGPNDIKTSIQHTFTSNWFNAIAIMTIIILLLWLARREILAYKNVKN